MLNSIEALIALEQYGTISEAAVRLRLTQSAVSKRIQALEKDLKYKLIEPDGRKVKLTHRAYKFLNKVKPLIIELKNLSISESDHFISKYSLGLSDSIAGSFGPLVLKKTLSTLKNLECTIHVHRTLMLNENIALGKYQLGICTEFETRKDLQYYSLIDEPMVLIFSELHNRQSKDLPLVTIEENSATWKSIGMKLKSDHSYLFERPNIIFVESFLAVYQMVKTGYGNGIIPLGLANELKLKKTDYRILKTKRPITLVTRKTITQLDFFDTFIKELRGNIKHYFDKI